MTLIHPNLTAALTTSGHFGATGTVQVGTETNPQGNPSFSWANVSELEDIPCAIAAAAADESRQPEFAYATRTHKALLDGDYPAIDPMTPHRFVSGGTNYDILGVEFDSQGVTTRLHLREVLK
jgi:hypothetical protein